MKSSPRFLLIGVPAIALVIGAVLGHFVPKKRLAPNVVQLRVDAQGNCVQMSNDMYDPKDPWVYHAGGQVTWVSPALDCRIEFDKDNLKCPFYPNCVYYCDQGRKTSDLAFGRHGEQFRYLSISIGNQPCKVNGNGIVLDH